MKRWLPTLVSVALLGLAFWLLDLGALGEALYAVELPTLLMAIALCYASLLALGARWIVIVSSVTHAAAARHWRTFFRASFLNSFTPANIGGDVYRVAALRDAAPDMATIVIALLRERLIGLVAFLSGYLLFAAAAAAAGPVDGVFVLACVPVAAGVTVLLASPWFVEAIARAPFIRNHPKISELGQRVARAMGFGTGMESLLLALFSLLALLTWIAAIAWLARALGVAVSLPMLGAIAVLTELARMIPISFQGIGVREASFAALVGLAGGSPEQGFVLAAVAYISLSVSLFLSGVSAWIMDFAGGCRP